MATAAIAEFYDSYAALKADEPYVRRILIAELSEEQQRSLDDRPTLTGLEDASDIHARRETYINRLRRRSSWLLEEKP